MHNPFSIYNLIDLQDIPLSVQRAQLLWDECQKSEITDYYKLFNNEILCTANYLRSLQQKVDSQVFLSIPQFLNFATRDQTDDFLQGFLLMSIADGEQINVDFEKRIIDYLRACGITTQILCRHLDLLPEAEAYLAGALHNFGLLILNNGFPEVMQKIDSYYHTGVDLAVCEEKILKFSHHMLGYVLARQWRYPPQICRLIYRHDYSSWAETPVHHAIMLANDIVCTQGYGHPWQKPDENAKKILPDAFKFFLMKEFELNILMHEIHETISNRLKKG